LLVSAFAFIGTLRYKWGMILVILGSALAGYAWKTFV
jgi:hypothetical protein